MSLAKTKPYFDVPTDYEDDFAAWSYEQAELLRLKRFAELDLANLVEEVEDMGREQRHALRSSYRVLILHLLKWQFQPARRSRSWQSTIVRERGNIEDRERDNPSLRVVADRLVMEAYPIARRQAAVESRLELSSFPETCPYSSTQLREQTFIPD